MPPAPSICRTDGTDDELDYVATDGTDKWRNKRNRARSKLTGRYKNQCDECKLWFMPSGVLINSSDPSFDWQGHLPLRCFRCLQLRGPWGQALLEEANTARRNGEDVRLPVPR